MKKLFYVPILFIFLLLFFIFKQIYPILLTLLTNPNPQTLQTQIVELGYYGIYITILLQILQSFLFFIPAFSIQIMAGFVYNFIQGTLIILFTFILSNLWLFKTLPNFQYLDKKLRKYPTLNLYLFFAIPIIPNILKPYIAKQKQMTTKNFITKLTYTNLPFIVISTLIGTSLLYKQYSFAIGLSLLYASSIVICFIFLYHKAKQR